jgi:low temperature requirement protein LtrA
MAVPDRDLPTHADGRKATWFELFFDLVFVVAVAQLSGAYAHHYDPGGAAVFALAFLAMWWCWLGHTFHATRFDDDSSSRRLLGFLQMAATALLGYGVVGAAGRAGLGLWRRHRRVQGAAGAGLLARTPLARRGRADPGLCHVVRGAGRAVAGRRYGAADGTRGACWALALGLDLASPWLVARHTAVVPPHPEHLPERFGLFTIILLGEGMASVVHALDHGPQLHGSSVVSALMGAVLSFGLWLLYFDRVKGQGERHIANSVAGRRLRLWAYGHVPLYMGIASLAAGTVALAAPGALTVVSGAIYLGGLALAGVGLVLLVRAREAGANG